jgi:hypothetical protein
MNRHVRNFRIVLILVLCSAAGAFAQKIKFGYDKSADFSKYKSYTWADSGVPPARPLLYAAVVGSIDQELQAKGLASLKQDGDLTLILAGGIDMGISTGAGRPILPNDYGTPPAMDATMWTGAEGPANSMGSYIPQGTLLLSLVDRARNKVVWSGSIKGTLDPEKKDKSLAAIGKAITKLLNHYPPKSK